MHIPEEYHPKTPNAFYFRIRTIAVYRFSFIRKNVFGDILFYNLTFFRVTNVFLWFEYCIFQLKIYKSVHIFPY